MAENELVLLDEPAKGVRRITLNRPEKRNAISNALEHQGARAIVRTGGDLQAGPHLQSFTGSSTELSEEIRSHQRKQQEESA